MDYRLYDVFHYSVSRNFLNSQLIAIVLYDIGIFELCKSCANDGGVIDNFRIEEHLPNDVPRVCFFLSKPSFGDEEDSVDFFSTFVASNSQTAQYVLVFQICVSHFYCVYDFYTIPASCSVDVDRVGVDELRLAYRLVALGKENARSKSVGTRRLSSTRSTNRHNCSLHQRPDYAMKKASGTLQQAAVKQLRGRRALRLLLCKMYTLVSTVDHAHSCGSQVASFSISCVLSHVAKNMFHCFLTIRFFGQQTRTNQKSEEICVDVQGLHLYRHNSSMQEEFQRQMSDYRTLLCF